MQQTHAVHALRAAKVRKTPLAAALAFAVFAVAAPAAHADPIAQLQSEINALNAKLQALEKTEKTPEVVAPTPTPQNNSGVVMTPTRSEILSGSEYVTKGTIPGSFLVPGTKTSVYLGGFVNFQGIYDPTENLGPKFSIGNLTPPGSSSRQQSHGTFHAQDKVSRMIFRTDTPSSYGDITTNISMDFYGYTAGGDNNQALQNNNWGSRIVYAYGTIGNWLVGQANSNFQDNVDQGETFDNAGPSGVPGGHTPQIRYTLPLGKGQQASFSIENPQTGYQDTRDNIEVATKTNLFPDITARYQRGGDWGHVQVSGVIRELGFTDDTGKRWSKWDGAGIVGATLNLPDGKGGYTQDNAGFQAWYGAMGRYIPDDFGANVASVLAVNDGTTAGVGASAIEVQPDTGLTVYAQHWWTPTLRSNLALGLNKQSLASFVPADSQNAVKTETVHVNLIEQPVPSLDLGIEFMWGRKTFQSSTGLAPANARRVEFGGIWHF